MPHLSMYLRASICSNTGMATHFPPSVNHAMQVISLQIFIEITVLLPESFRGRCSFGEPMGDFSPVMHVFKHKQCQIFYIDLSYISDYLCPTHCKLNDGLLLQHHLIFSQENAQPN